MPRNEFVKAVWLLSNHPHFGNFYTGVIMFNIGLMATEHYQQPPWYGQMYICMYIYLSIYLSIYIYIHIDR